MRSIPERRSLEFLWSRQDDFAKDRPRMKYHNQSLTNAIDLLLDEVQELNGHTEYGLTLSEYRRQEIADIGWFVMSLAHVLNIHMVDESITTIVNKSPKREPTAEWSEAIDEPIYESIKAEMESGASQLSEYIHGLGDDSEVDREKVEQYLNIILGHAWSLCAFVGEELDSAMMEKMARNHLKHAPKYYQDSTISYEDARRQASVDWKASRGNERFYQTETTTR